eukprot:scaffold60539_cov57-Phaeocystis_antarctica.AAC.2
MVVFERSVGLELITSTAAVKRSRCDHVLVPKLFPFGCVSCIKAAHTLSTTAPSGHAGGASSGFTTAPSGHAAASSSGFTTAPSGHAGGASSSGFTTAPSGHAGGASSCF